MNWGKSIVVAFILFASFIGVLVSVCLRQDIALVADDYYEQELRYQDQLDRVYNTANLAVKPEIRLKDKSLEVEFSRFKDITSGSVEVFRPSDQRFDRRFKLGNSNLVIQEFDVSNLPTGMYKVRLQWAMDDKEYFLESMIYR